MAFIGPRLKLLQILLEVNLVLGNIYLKVWFPGPLLQPGPKTQLLITTPSRRSKTWASRPKVRHLPLPLPCPGTRGGPPEITSFQRRLAITHDDHRTIHSALKLIHHVENDLVLIYHKIYETCTFSNEIYANAALADVCVFKSFDRGEKEGSGQLEVALP